MSSREVTIKILNEVHIMLVGLHGTDLQVLYDKFGVFVPNHFFNPRFKLGQWDGRIRYFTKDGKTYLYLLDQILPMLKKMGYKVKLDDRRSVEAFQPDFIDCNIFSNIMHPDSGLPIILRPHQVEAVNTLITNGFGVCVAGTGAGKTLAAAALVKTYDNLGVRSITIVPDQTLIRQTKRDYINCGLDTGEYSGATKTLDHRHIVSTWQALQNNPALMTTFDMVIVDECHGLRGNKLRNIVCDYAANIPYRFGFTGTLPKDESERILVHISIGPEQYNISAHELIDLGLLSSIDINILQLEEDLTEQYNQYVSELSPLETPIKYNAFKDGYFGDFSAEKSYVQRKSTRLEWIANRICEKRDEKKGNVLCLVDSIPLGRQLVALIPGAIFINGQDVKKAEKRQSIYDLFKTEDNLVVIATVNIAGTGLSIDRIFNLFTVDIGKSFIRVIQAIGRGLRMSSDKNHLSHTDICSDLKYGKKHLAERIRFYKEAHYPHKKQIIKYDKFKETL